MRLLGLGTDICEHNARAPRMIRNNCPTTCIWIRFSDTRALNSSRMLIFIDWRKMGNLLDEFGVDWSLKCVSRKL